MELVNRLDVKMEIEIKDGSWFLTWATETGQIRRGVSLVLPNQCCI